MRRVEHFQTFKVHLEQCICSSSISHHRVIIKDDPCHISLFHLSPIDLFLCSSILEYDVKGMDNAGNVAENGEQNVD